MPQDPVIKTATAGTKSKASDYNANFTNMVNYVKDAMSESETAIRSALTTYTTVNTLSTQGTISLTSNTINTITPDGAVEFVLPTITGEDASKYHQILVMVNMPTVYTIDVGTDYCYNGTFPDLRLAGNYDIIYTYDNVKADWCVGAIFKGEVE